MKSDTTAAKILVLTARDGGPLARPEYRPANLLSEVRETLAKLSPLAAEGEKLCRHLRGHYRSLFVSRHRWLPFN